MIAGRTLENAIEEEPRERDTIVAPAHHEFVNVQNVNVAVDPVVVLTNGDAVAIDANQKSSIGETEMIAGTEIKRRNAASDLDLVIVNATVRSVSGTRETAIVIARSESPRLRKAILRLKRNLSTVRN